MTRIIGKVRLAFNAKVILYHLKRSNKTNNVSSVTTTILWNSSWKIHVTGQRTVEKNSLLNILLLLPMPQATDSTNLHILYKNKLQQTIALIFSLQIANNRSHHRMLSLHLFYELAYDWNVKYASKYRYPPKKTDDDWQKTTKQ